MKLRGRSVPLRSRKVTATTKTPVPPKQPIARTLRASGSPRNSPSVAALSQGLCAHVIDHQKMPGMGQRNCRPTDVETRTANLTFHNRDLTRQSADHSMLLAQPGIRSDSAPLVDIVSPNLRLQILMGQDINLEALLLPDINSDQPDLTFHNIWPVTADARLQCSLSISEFVTAFSIYKRIMCGAYPQRSKELDWYICDIVDIASKFADQAAYGYRKLFSARAAALPTELKIKVDWSYRDQAIFIRGQYWPSGIVVACVCVYVCLSVNHELVRAIIHQPFKLGSPNLDQRCKRPCLRSLLFCGVIDGDLQGQIELESQNSPHFWLVSLSGR